MNALVQRAKDFAREAHGGQMYGDRPYIYHLGMVVDVANHAGFYNPYIVSACWLHDTIEDTSVTFEDIVSEFGREIGRTVFAVTNEPGKNRKERAIRTYPKIRAAGRSALVVKLSDRIANARHSRQHNHNMLKMYQKEYPVFREYLKVQGELKQLWAELDLFINHKVETVPG